MIEVQFHKIRALEEIVPRFADRPKPEQRSDWKPYQYLPHNIFRKIAVHQ